MDYLIVDGYNMIGAWPHLQNMKQDDFSGARDALIHHLTEYQVYTKRNVIVVFDAHLAKGIEKKVQNAKVEVIYTREKETADERIERMAKEVKNVRNQVYVATSDFTEQWTIFSQGALRVSARELLLEIENMKKDVKEQITDNSTTQKVGTRIKMSKEVEEKLEKFRRGY